MSTPHELEARPLTYRDLDATPDDGNRWELIDGVLFVTPFPSHAHQHAAGRLFVLLDGHVRSQRLGEVYFAGLKVVLDEPTGVGPDLVYISQARLAGMREDGFHGAPDLIVEILSSKPALDTQVKLAKYAQSGVPYYWIVDPKTRRLAEQRLTGTRYVRVCEIEGEALFSPELFAGLSLPLGELWLPQP